MQEVSGSIPLSSTIFLNIFDIFVNGLNGSGMPFKRPVTLLHAVSGHCTVTGNWDETVREFAALQANGRNGTESRRSAFGVQKVKISHLIHEA